MTDLEVGDQVLVMPGWDGVPVAIKLDSVDVGDPVLLYNLKAEDKIAVPRLQFDVGSYVFAAPSFDFAGFDWKVDFDFDLLPFYLQITDKWCGVKATSLCWCGGYKTIISYDGKIYQTLNSGRTWQEISTPGRTYSKMIKVGDNVLGLSGSSIYLSDDDGFSWSRRYTGRTTMTDIRDCGALVIAAGYYSGTTGGHIVTSSDGGSGWDLRWEINSARAFPLVLNDTYLATSQYADTTPAIYRWNGTDYVFKISFGVPWSTVRQAHYHNGYYFVTYDWHAATVARFPSDFSTAAGVGSWGCFGSSCYTQSTSIFTGPSGALFVTYLCVSQSTCGTYPDVNVPIKRSTTNGGSWSDFRGDFFRDRCMFATINAGDNIIGTVYGSDVWALGDP